MLCFFFTAQSVEILKEYETSLKIPLKPAMFRELMDAHVSIDTYMVMYYKNNVRMSRNVFQLKNVIRKKNLLKVLKYDDLMYLFPFTRTESFEYQAAVPEDRTLTTIIYRHVILDESISNNATMRVAIETWSKDEGVSLWFTAEVEYSQAAFHGYTDNKKVEDLFFDIILEKYMYYLSDIRTKDLLRFSPLEIINYGSRDFKQMNQVYAAVEERIVLKLDGYKCKFAIQNGKLTYLDAKHNYCQGVCDGLGWFENVVFQAEVMEGNNIVITDVLGGFVHGKDLHMPQPLEVYEIFDWIRMQQHYQPMVMTLFNKPNVTFKVHLQQLIEPGAKEVSPFKSDGYIIIQNANIFKFKPPTLDVKVDGGYLKVTGRAEPITDQHFPQLEDGSIVEVQQNKEGNYVVLRIRFDRNVPCDNKQFEEFIEELAFMRNCVRASISDEAKNELNIVNKNIAEYQQNKLKKKGAQASSDMEH